VQKKVRDHFKTSGICFQFQQELPGDSAGRRVERR